MSAKDTNIFKRVSLPLRDKVYFYQMLAMSLEAGMPIMKSLNIIQEKLSNEIFRRIVAELIEFIKKGNTFAKALEKFPGAFSDTEIAIISTGEQSGHLERVLGNLSNSLEHTMEVQSKVKSALVYPATVIAALFIASAFIITTIIPKLLELYESNNADIPDSLAFLANTGLFIQKQPFVIMGVLALLGVIAYTWLRSPQGIRAKEEVLLRLPYFNVVYKKSIVAKTMRTVGLLMDSGISLLHALKMAGRTAENHQYKLAFDRARRHVESGERLSVAMAKSPELFPKDLTELLSIGEDTAEIGPLAQKVAQQYEKDISYQMKNALTLVGPLAVMLIGVVVAGFALLMLDSVFSLTDIFT